ncbi:MAG: HNH endonuclease [Bacteroidota bacterium]
MTQVLVLNQDYQAISVCKAEKALILVLGQKAELINDVADRKFRSVKRDFQFPSIIRLYRYVPLPYRKVALSRENIFRRDGYRCVYCGSKYDLTLDHLIPSSKGGRTSWDNLVTACRDCNSHKGDLSLEDSGLELDFKPFRPSWIMFLRQFAGLVREDWKPYLFY